MAFKTVHPIFPIAIGEYECNYPITGKHLNALQNLENIKNISNFTSVNNYVLNNIDDLKEIRDFCSESLKDHFSRIYNPLNDVEIYMTQSWCNYTHAGEWHQLHNHSNSIVSGVFYIQCSENDKIFFSRGKGHERILISSKESSIFNTETWWMKCKVGTLYLFDSSVGHFVDVRESNDSVLRISISFNSFIKGKIGNQFDLTELILE